MEFEKSPYFEYTDINNETFSIDFQTLLNKYNYIGIFGNLGTTKRQINQFKSNFAIVVIRFTAGPQTSFFSLI